MRILAVFFLMVALSSCFDEGDCLITNSNLVRVSIRTFSNKAPATRTFTSISVLGGETLYANQALGTLNLPVNPGLTEMSYVFAYDGKADTLSLNYTNLSAVLSPACGAFPYQQNLATGYNTFGQDSVEVTNRLLLKDVVENVRIYF